MKKLMLLVAVTMFLSCLSSAHAITYTFTPNDGGGTMNDLYDLDHNYIYLWGINWNLNPNETITGATLSIDNIYNWDWKYNVLKFYLLDNVRNSDNAGQVDIIRISDSQNTTPNYEVGRYEVGYNSSTLDDKFTDYVFLDQRENLPGPGPSYDSDKNAIDISYSFDSLEISTLLGYLSTANPFGTNANFGIGFDPDCHFYNSGVTLEITTTMTPVPEPATLLLLGSGLAGVSLFRRK